MTAYELVVVLFLAISVFGLSVAGIMTSKRIDLLSKRVEMLERIHLLPHTHDEDEE